MSGTSQRSEGWRKQKIRRFYFLILSLLLVISQSQGANSLADDYNPDYDPVTGKPKCINCHPGEKKYSIDYTRDDSCFACHGPWLSEKFMAIDARYDNGVTVDKTPASNDADHPLTLTLSPDGRGPERRGMDEGAPFSSSSVSKKEMGVLSDDMAHIPEGEFTMGSNEWWPKSQPEHKRVLKAFLIDKYEVTNKRYTKFVDATKQKPPADWPANWKTKWIDGEFPREQAGHPETALSKDQDNHTDAELPKDRGNHPVVFVSWYDANDFCFWEGKRLPTEAEWEKAARGTDTSTFPWGDKFDAKKGNMPQYGKNDTMPVGSFEEGKSPYGVYDMAGNVWEWTSDWFKPYPGNSHPDENYGEKYKVLKGGSWYDCTYYKCGISAPVYNKIFFNPLTFNNNFGFRCAKDAE